MYLPATRFCSGNVFGPIIGEQKAARCVAAIILEHLVDLRAGLGHTHLARDIPTIKRGQEVIFCLGNVEGLDPEIGQRENGHASGLQRAQRGDGQVNGGLRQLKPAIMPPQDFRAKFGMLFGGVIDHVAEVLPLIDQFVHAVQVNSGEHLFPAGLADPLVVKLFRLPPDQDVSNIKYDGGNRSILCHTATLEGLRGNGSHNLILRVIRRNDRIAVGPRVRGDPPG